ncbi:MAG TPA: flagellin [Ilumatobacter sp.]|nr:flagellin [Ilumatobacter sp.]
MRVTNSMVLTSTLRDLNATLSRLQSAQIDLSTGRVVRKASDDPAKAAAAMALHNQIRRSEHRSRELTDAQGWLNVADTALVNGLDLLNRAKELASRAASTGATDAEARTAIAAELGNLREEMIAIANTKYLNRSVFNGTTTGDAYDLAGAYLGNDSQIMRAVAPGTVLRTNITGEEAFGVQASPEGDVFAVIDRLAAAIAAGDQAAMTAEQDNLDAARTRMASATAELGSRGARLDSIRARAAADEVSLRDTLSQIEDTDLAKALMDVKNRENAYNAALGAAARVIPNSLLNYLR